MKLLISGVVQYYNTHIEMIDLIQSPNCLLQHSCDTDLL